MRVVGDDAVSVDVSDDATTVVVSAASGVVSATASDGGGFCHSDENPLRWSCARFTSESPRLFTAPGSFAPWGQLNTAPGIFQSVEASI